MEDVCFIINVYKESRDQIQSLVSDLKKFYETKNIILVYDGIDPHAIDSCNEIKYERLKYPYNRGRWTQRYLEFFLNKSDSNYLIKLDPDCSISKKYEFPKKYTGIFGYINLVVMGKWDYILQGGRYGIDRDSVKKIVDSKFLLNNLKDYNNVQDLIMTEALHRLNIKGTICKDFMDSFLHKKRGSEECRLYKLQPSKLSKNVMDAKETS